MLLWIQAYVGGEVALEAISEGIKLLATVAGVLAIAYAGLMLATNTNPLARNEWKDMIVGVITGLSVIYLAPWLAAALSGGNYCG